MEQGDLREQGAQGAREAGAAYVGTNESRGSNEAGRSERAHGAGRARGLGQAAGFPNLQRGAASRGSRIYTEEQGK